MAVSPATSAAGALLPGGAINPLMFLGGGLQGPLTSAFMMMAMGQPLPSTLMFAGMQVAANPMALAALKDMFGQAQKLPVWDQLGKGLNNQNSFKFLNDNWAKLGKFANDEKAIQGLFKGLKLQTGAPAALVKEWSKVGPQVSKDLANFTRRTLQIATSPKGGLGTAMEFIKTQLPFLSKLTKFAKWLPLVGIVAAVVTLIAVYANQNSTPGEKTGALLGLCAGAASCVPGVGTAASMAMSVGADAAGRVVDAAAGPPKGWTA
jgi:hypothetical protein